jgi:NADH-quinone oxidoreductase subunit N
MSAATKVAASVVLLRVLTTAFPEWSGIWTVAVAVLACASLAVGNFAALVQQDVKRLLAYSSISHAGFLLIAVSANSELGASALLYYLGPYATKSVGALGVVTLRELEIGRPVQIADLQGLGWERPWMGASMWVFMLGFAGFPLTGGLIGKLYVFAAAYEAGWWWLVVVGVAATALSLYYYLGVVRALYMRGPSVTAASVAAGASPPTVYPIQAAVLVSLAVTVGSFFFAGPIADAARKAAEQLF